MKKFIVGILIAVLLSTVAIQAQTKAIAIGIFIGSLPFDAPIQVTEDGIKDNFLVLCYRKTPEVKQLDVVSVDIPDGTSLQNQRILITDAFVARCAQFGLTVQRGDVMFPAFQTGL